MGTLIGIALWQQFSAAIDMLEGAVMGCPESLWNAHVWIVPQTSQFPPQFADFWYVSYHTLVWLDLYLSGVPEEEFAPPAPFPQGEIDSLETTPDQPYPKEVLRPYFAFCREKCHMLLLGLSDEQARRPLQYPWSRGQQVSYLELQLYNLRHVQEHAAQLSLFLGQHGIPDEDVHWVARAKRD